MTKKARRNFRKTHRWGAIIIALPFLVVIATGLLLQIKKDVAWVQPPSAKSNDVSLNIAFDQILDIASTVEEADISSWDDVDRLDVRPDKGMVKVRAINHWEVQIDTNTGDILQIAYRRSDIIEALHDGSWFSDAAKYWVFLPSGIIVLVLWVSGMYLYFIHKLRKRENKRWREGLEKHKK